MNTASRPVCKDSLQTKILFRIDVQISAYRSARDDKIRLLGFYAMYASPGTRIFMVYFVETQLLASKSAKINAILRKTMIVMNPHDKDTV